MSCTKAVLERNGARVCLRQVLTTGARLWMGAVARQQQVRQGVRKNWRAGAISYASSTCNGEPRRNTGFAPHSYAKRRGKCVGAATVERAVLLTVCNVSQQSHMRSTSNGFKLARQEAFLRTDNYTCTCELRLQARAT